MSLSSVASVSLPRVVLIEPSGGTNVGSICRAIKNTGGGQLTLVRPEFPRDEAKRMAVHAGDVLASAVIVDDFAEAIAGCGLVVATTAKTETFRNRALPIRSSMQAVCGWQRSKGKDAEVALVFGREDRGLSNDEISACHWITSIPSSAEYRSLNLSQAVMIALYELMLVRAADLPSSAAESDHFGSVPHNAGVADPDDPADARSVEAMFVDLEHCLYQIGFLGADDGAHVMRSIRSIFARAVLDDRELRILRGLTRQIRWFGEGGHSVISAKKARGEKLR